MKEGARAFKTHDCIAWLLTIPVHIPHELTAEATATQAASTQTRSAIDILISLACPRSRVTMLHSFRIRIKPAWEG